MSELGKSTACLKNVKNYFKKHAFYGTQYSVMNVCTCDI